MHAGIESLSDRDLIGRIVYAASLVSDPHETDPILDTLRLITARQPAGQALNSRDRAELLHVAAQIETYLTQQDPVRSFTKEALQRKIQQHFETLDRPWWRRSIWSLVLVLGSAAALSLLPFIIPNTIERGLKLQLALALFFFGTHNGNIWFFLSALKNFTHQLRVAFGYLAVGILLVGIVGAQFTLLSLFNMQDSPWARYGGFLFVTPVAYIFLYVGVYRFARQLGIRSKLMSIPLFGLAITVVPLVLLLVPHHAVQRGEYVYFVATLVSGGMCAVMISWIALLLRTFWPQPAFHF